MQSKSGYLYKLGEGPINYDWNERYCILDKSKFSYYNEPTDKSPRKIFQLLNANISQIKPLNGHNFSFTLTLENDTTVYSFSHESFPEAEKWRQGMLQASYGDTKVVQPTIRPSLLPQNSSQQGEVPIEMTLSLERAKKADESDENWSVFSIKDDIKIMTLDFKPFSPVKSLKNPKLIGIIAAVFVFSWLLGIPMYIVLSILGYLFYTKFHSQPVLNSRFSQVKSRFFIPQDAKEIFSLIMDVKKRPQWDYLCRDGNSVEFIDDHTDVIHRWVRAPIRFPWAGLVQDRDFIFSRYWMIDNQMNYYIVMQSINRSEYLANLDGIPGSGYEVIVIKPLDENNSVVTWVASIEFGGTLFRHAEEALRLTWVRCPLGLYHYLQHNPPVEDYLLQPKQQPISNSQTNKYILYNEGRPVPLEQRLFRGYVRNAEGGILCENKEDLASQKGVIIELIQKAGAVLMEGKTIVGVSLPVRIFEARSTLERMVDWWATAPIYLTKAAQTNDPVERLKNVICFCMSTLYYGTRQLKPFNPILGETYEGEFADGTKIFIEHTSHHPPIASFYVEGPDNLYVYQGYYEFIARVSGNSVIGRQKGPNIIRFANGGVVSFGRPLWVLQGIIYGQRILEYSENVEFKDEANGLVGQIQFAERGGWLKRANTSSDFFTGQITGPSGQISKISGNYLESIDFDGQRYWELATSPIYKGIPKAEPLPSDCRYREDMIELAKGNMHSADEQKGRLEVLQRHDRALRNENTPKS